MYRNSINPSSASINLAILQNEEILCLFRGVDHLDEQLD